MATITVEDSENLEKAIKKFKRMVEKEGIIREYKKREYKPFNIGFGTSREDYDYYYPTSWNNIYNTENDDEVSIYIQWKKDGIELDDFIEGKSEYEAWGKFFLEHIDVSYNDITDFEIYDDNDYDSYMNKYFGKSI